MTTSTTAQHHDPLDAAVRLAPAIREAAPAIDAARQLPPEIVKAMRDAGLFHTNVPSVYGGGQCDPVTTCRVIETVAAADGSAGWCLMIAAQNATIAGFVEPSFAARIWGNGGIAAGSARPIGRAEAEGDGYRVNGRWPFASGSSHATWFAGESVLYHDGEPVRDEAGNPRSAFAVVPRDEVTIHDTWFTTGLRGTASNDFSIDGRWLPAGQVVSLGEPYLDWPMYRSLALMFTTHGAQGLGIGEAAIATAIETARTKIGWGTDRPMTENARMQLAVAEAVVLVESAKEHLHGATNRLWETLSRGEQPGALNGRARLASSHAVTATVRAVDLLHSAMATSSIFSKNALERQFRDIHTAAAHVMVGPLTYEAAGRVEMGLPAGMPFFE